MNKDKVIMELITLQGGDDPEAEHIEADKTLCRFLSDLGHQDVVDEYLKITKWYS